MTNNTELIAQLEKTATWLEVYDGNMFQYDAEAENIRTAIRALQAMERKPLTQEKAEELAHRRATTYTHRSAPGYSSYAFVPHTLMDFVRDLEDHHRIKD